MLERNIGSTQDWGLRLPYCVFSINITLSETTGFSLFHLLFGHPVRFPGVVDFGVNPAYFVDEESYLQFFRENLAQIMDQSNKNSAESREKMINRYNKLAKVTLNNFKVNDKVMVVFPGKNRNAKNRKLL
jgi:hypothetical protein